jgi:HK97 family phage major capsid protein
MNKQEYIAKRKSLLDEAQTLLNVGDVESYTAKEKEIKDLDAKFEAIATAQANMNALAGNAVVTNIANKGVTVDNPFIGAKIDNLITPPKNDDAVYRTAFAKNMMGLPMDQNESELFNSINTEFKNATQTAATHTVLVPETVKAGIWKEIGEAHAIVSDLAMTFVPGDLTIIKETNTLSDGQAQRENDEAGDDDELGLGELNLTGCELSKAITVSWKLKKMSVDSFLDYITTKIAEKMGNALAKWVTEGKGKPGADDTWKPQARGIAVALEAESSTPQIITYDDKSPVDYKKMTAALAKIKSGYLNGSAIYAKNDIIWNVLANIVDGTGKPMFVSDVTSGGVGRIFGLVVKEEDGVSDGEIIIGNVAKGYAMNANENITMYQEDHVKLRKIDYMGYAIIDGDVLTTKAFVLIKKA